MTTIRSRILLIMSVLTLVPLLLAFAIGFPADASPKTETPPAVAIEEAPADEAFEVTIDTGVVNLGGGTAISALTVTATTIAGGN